MQLDRRQVRHEHQRRRDGRAPSTTRCVPVARRRSWNRVNQSGAFDGTSFCQKPLASIAVGEPLEVDGRDRQVRQHQRRDRSRSGGSGRAWSAARAAVAAGEEHLVQVRQRARRRRRRARCRRCRSASSASNCAGRRRVPAQSCGVGSGPAAVSADDGPRRWSGRSAPNVGGPRCPSPSHRVLVGGVDHQPLLALAGAPAGADQRHATRSFSP